MRRILPKHPNQTLGSASLDGISPMPTPEQQPILGQGRRVKGLERDILLLHTATQCFISTSKQLSLQVFYEMKM